MEATEEKTRVEGQASACKERLGLAERWDAEECGLRLLDVAILREQVLCVTGSPRGWHASPRVVMEVSGVVRTTVVRSLPTADRLMGLVVRRAR